VCVLIERETVHHGDGVCVRACMPVSVSVRTLMDAPASGARWAWWRARYAANGYTVIGWCSSWNSCAQRDWQERRSESEQRNGCGKNLGRTRMDGRCEAIVAGTQHLVPW